MGFLRYQERVVYWRLWRLRGDPSQGAIGRSTGGGRPSDSEAVRPKADRMFVFCRPDWWTLEAVCFANDWRICFCFMRCRDGYRTHPGTDPTAKAHAMCRVIALKSSC